MRDDGRCVNCLTILTKDEYSSGFCWQCGWIIGRSINGEKDVPEGFGIFPCGRCGGSGRLPRITADGPDTCKCAAESGGKCNGRGWIARKTADREGEG